LYAVVAGVFGVFALLVAFVGLFGVLSAAVAARRRELGVRVALGATPGRMARLVVGQSVVPLALGAAAGCAAAAFLTRYLSSLLYGVVPHDPLTFAAVPLVIVAAAALACLVPARRAAAVDPLTALRQG
jgi:ABC-type antimicrobial peptide transport system permease subunit